MKAFRNFSIGAGLTLLSLAFSSCHKDNNDVSVSGMYNISGSANGSQVVPSVSGSATGNITGTYNANTNLLTYNMTWVNLSGTASTAAFYSGSTGTNGSLINNVSITTSGSTGASVGTMTLTDAQETALLNGSFYYVISTAAHASGEIRGQIVATKQ